MKNQGFALVEVLLSAALLSVVVVAVVGAILFGQEGAALSGNRNLAVMLSEEGAEAVRNIRDAGYANLTNGTFGLTTTGSVWNLSGASDTTDSYIRSVTVTTATEGASFKDMVSTVTWQQNLQRPGNMTLTTRLTGWNRVFGNWSSPSQESSLDLAGNQAGNKVAVWGDHAVVVRNGGTPDFAVISVSAPATPTLTGSLSLSGNPLNVFVSGNYAFVASDDNAQELQIIDVGTPSAPVQVGSYNATGNDDANGVYVVGTTAYLTRSGNADNFVVIDVSTPGSPTQIGITSLSGPEYEVYVEGGYAYVSSGDNGSELQVVNISTPSSPTLTSSLNLGSNNDAGTITGYPGVVFLGQTGGSVSSVDVSIPGTPTLVGSFTGANNIKDLCLGLSSGQLLVVMDVGTTEFQSLDVSTIGSITSMGSANLTNSLNGVVYDQIRDRAYAVGSDNNQEFIVIKPL